MEHDFSWCSEKTQKISAKQYAANQRKPVYPTNLAYQCDAIVCLYVPKKKKPVEFLAIMHMSGEVE